MASASPTDELAAAGDCCDTMRGILQSDDFEPLFSLENDGAIYVTVGLGETEEDGAGLLDHVLSYCPFCGQKLPDPASPAIEVNEI